jgi:hypothetical protein
MYVEEQLTCACFPASRNGKEHSHKNYHWEERPFRHKGNVVSTVSWGQHACLAQAKWHSNLLCTSTRFIHPTSYRNPIMWSHIVKLASLCSNAASNALMELRWSLQNFCNQFYFCDLIFILFVWCRLIFQFADACGLHQEQGGGRGRRKGKLSISYRDFFHNVKLNYSKKGIAH